MNYVITEQTKLRDIIESVERSGTTDLELSYQNDTYLKRYPYHVDILTRIFSTMGVDIKIHVTNPNTDSPEQVGAVVANPTSDPVIKPISTAPEVLPVVSSTVDSEKISKRRVSFGVTPKKLMIVVMIFILMSLAGAGAYAYYYLPRGTVTLLVAEKTLERTLDVTASTTVEAVDSQTSTIPAQLVSVEMQASDNFAATGKKTVGEHATGKVEIKNFSTTTFRLNEGSVITSQSDSSLQYVLTEAVTIPKATITQPSDDTKILEAGIMEVSVEAVDIGEQYNVAANTRFMVSGYEVSDVYGVNGIPLAGGLTKEVTVISTEDQNNARSQLVAKIKADTPGAIDKKILSTQRYDKDSIQSKGVSETFSDQVGAEVTTFSLTTKMSPSVLVYDHNDVSSLLQVLVADAVPDGYELSSDNDPVGVDKVEVEDSETLQLKARISALVVPVIDTYAIKNQLIGKRPADAEQILKNIPEITGYTITLWPTLPDVLKSFPHLEERLSVTVEIAQ